jgi:hypothetical protein
MKILYRISEGGNSKVKPSYVYDKQSMFLHFINVFKSHDIYVFADNVGEDFYTFMTENYIPSKIFRLSLGNGASFMYSLDFAIKNFDDNEKLYFAEDDYIYTPNAPKIIEEGLSITDYSTGYDHPDKYINHSEGGPNPFIYDGGETTRVVITNSSHWKYTNSCCMTFATTVKTMKDDYSVFRSNIHSDFYIFRALVTKKERRIASCIPSVCTHGETDWLAKLIDWDEIYNNSMASITNL